MTVHDIIPMKSDHPGARMLCAERVWREPMCEALRLCARRGHARSTLSIRVDLRASYAVPRGVMPRRASAAVRGAGGVVTGATTVYRSRAPSRVPENRPSCSRTLRSVNIKLVNELAMVRATTYGLSELSPVMPGQAWPRGAPNVAMGGIAQLLPSFLGDGQTPRPLAALPLVHVHRHPTTASSASARPRGAARSARAAASAGTEDHTGRPASGLPLMPSGMARRIAALARLRRRPTR